MTTHWIPEQLLEPGVGVILDTETTGFDPDTGDREVGERFLGTVVKTTPFGAFVSLLPGKDGLVHVSQISSERVEKVSDKLKEGDVVKVKVLEVDKQGRIRLSMKAVTNDAPPAEG